MRIGRAFAVGCVVASFAALVPAAHAGTYEVAVCHDPGTALSAPTDGISFPAAGPFVDAGVYDGCGAGGYVFAALDGLAPHGPGDVAAWRFTAPAHTSITAAQIWRSFYAGTSLPFASPIDTIDTVAADGTASTVAACAQTYGCTRIGGGDLGAASALVYGGLDGTAAIQGAAGCGGGQTCSSGGSAACLELGADPCTAANDLFAMVVSLVDGSAPVTDNVSGSLVAPGVLSGAVGLSFDASDTGSGLYATTITVDGETAVAVPFSPNGGRCATLGDGNGSILRFDWTVPCLLAGTGSVVLDTATLPDGPHQVTVTVSDAAQNGSVVWAGTIETHNAPAGGTPAVTGTAQTGQTLLAAPGSWTPTPSSYAYQWLRCTAAGSNCVAIPGATAASYAAGVADAYGTLEVAMTAIGATGSSSATSAPSPVVADADGYLSPPGPPALLGGSQPALSGAAKQGATLAAASGRWSNGPLRIAYQWQRCDAAGLGCTAIARASAPNYRLRARDDYSRVRVVVSATGPGGSSTAASGATRVIADLRGATSGPAAGHVANGRGACVGARLRTRLDGATVPFGRAVALRGSLRCATVPIAGAVVDLALAPSAGSIAPTVAHVRTRADGSFSYLVGAGPSRQITVRYHPFAGEAAAVASATLSLRVRPEVSLAISPARTTNGHTITFTGTVSGGDEPRGGLTLDVEYLEGRRWMVYDTVLARAGDGRFTYDYTFHRTTQPITYTFRIAIPQGGVSDYPFLSSASPPRSVHVDP